MDTGRRMGVNRLVGKKERAQKRTDNGLGGYGMSKTLEGVRCAVALSLGFIFLSGCSYISTLDPNDNSRLEQLKLERQAQAAQGITEMPLMAIRQRIDQLQTPRLIFRTSLREDQIIVEAFSKLADVEAAVTEALAGNPSALEHLAFINGVRSAEDALPKKIQAIEPEGIIIALAELESWGPVFWVQEIYQSERSKEPEELFQAIQELVLLKDQTAKPLTKPKYEISLREGKGQLLATLTLDEEQRIKIEGADGSVATYTLLNSTQYSVLTTLSRTILYDFMINGEIEEPGSEPNPNPDTPGLDLPFMDPYAVIGQEFTMLSHEGELQLEYINLEMALVGYTDEDKFPDLGNSNGLEQKIPLVGKPVEQFQIIYISGRLEAEGSEFKVDSQRIIDMEEAQRIASAWNLDDSVIKDNLVLLRAKTMYSFLNAVKRIGYLLDPAVNWR